MEDNKQLFTQQEVATSAAGRGLQKTAELTNSANQIAMNIMKTLMSDEKYRQQILDSQKTNDVMDQIINELHTFTTEHEFLNDVQVEELERMLKSQQSKRSRAKSKVMTMENYVSMLTAAIAERMIRSAGNFEKTSNVGVRRTTVSFSEEELLALAADTEKLAKAIRNVQSKKCILKGKADFDAESDEYKRILEAEEQLKALRGGTVVKAEIPQEMVEKAEKADTVKNILTEVEDIEKMTARDSKALLAKIKEAIEVTQ